MKIILFALLLFFSVQVFAQKTITGKVSDENGNPLSSVSVLIKGAKTGTVTNNDGMFSILLPSNATTLVFSFLDKESKEVVVGSSTSLNVLLVGKDKSMDEVVVVGYTVQKKKDVAAAITKISGADIATMPQPSFSQAMQGRSAGVSIAANSGIPGGSINVRIRGAGSITAGNEPLYIVDGIQINSSNSASVAASTSTTVTTRTENNPLSFLNNADIESIEILKDAAASAIYGAKAAGGVVLVTTKKGVAGKARYNVNMYYGQLSPIRTQTPMNTLEYITARAEGQSFKTGGVTSFATARASVLAELALSPTLTNEQIKALPGTNWVNETWGTGRMRNLELSMAAGSQTTNIYMSGSYNFQESIIKPTDYERGTFLLKGSHKASSKLMFESQINLSTFLQSGTFGQVGEGNFTINPAYAATQILSINPVYNSSGNFYNLAGAVGEPWFSSFANNIVAASALLKNKTRTNQMVGSIGVTYNINADFTIKSMASLDYRLAQVKSYWDPRLIGAQYSSVGGQGEIASNWNTNFLTNTVLNYKKTLGNGHNISGLLGVEYRNDIGQGTSAVAQGFPTADFQNLSSAAAPVAITETWTGYATWSQFTRLGYNFKSKYIAGFTLRRDGSSRFGSNNQYGYFPSVQFAWNAKDERFMKDMKSISELKFRYSYGESGNDQLGNFASRQLYGATNVYNNNPTINPSQLGNPDLTWETRSEHNFGLDLGLFRNRISLTFDAFNRVNKNLLLDRSLYSTTGFSSITQNAGAVRNRGLEFLIRVKPFDGEFKWESSFNITFIDNEITKLYDTVKILPGDPATRIGNSIDGNFTNMWAGINPATGRTMWLDKNGNITYNPSADDRILFGSINPRTYGGWNNSFSYKGIGLVGFFQYEYGRRRFDTQLQQEARLGFGSQNSIKYIYDNRWTTPGQITFVPRANDATGDMGSASWNTGTRFFGKSDYIRLKQITLSYTFSATLLKKVKLNSVRMYVQGVNLWTYTKWVGTDPEFTGGNATVIPQSKNITAGVQIGF